MIGFFSIFSTYYQIQDDMETNIFKISTKDCIFFLHIIHISTFLCR
jgi:hypothetical protein